MKERRPHVFVVQDLGKHNLLGAEEFGDITILTNKRISAYSSGVEQVTAQITVTLNDHFKEGDYLLLSGDPALIGFAFTIAMLKTGGSINVLKWDRQTSQYYNTYFEVKSLIEKGGNF